MTRVRAAAAAVAVAATIAVPAGPALAGRTLPCIPHEAVDGRCEQWAAAYSGTAFDSTRAVTLSPDGRTVFVAGETETDDGLRVLTAAYEVVEGGQRWAKVDGRDGDEYDSASAIAVSPDGSSVFTLANACGATTDGSTCDGFLIARDPSTGEERWSALFDGEGHGLDGFMGIGVDPASDTVFVGGQTASPRGDTDYLLGAYDAATGDLLWSTTYGDPAGPDRAAGLALARHTVILTGRSLGTEDAEDIVTVAFDTRPSREGEVVWEARYDGPGGSDEALAIDVDERGEVVAVAGESQRATSPLPDPVVAAYDAGSGSQRWVRRFDDAGQLGGTFYDVAVSPKGEHVVATGYTQRSGGTAGAKGPSTLAYDAASGLRRWAINLPEGLNMDAEFGPDGRHVYVTGSTYTRRGSMHRTVSYLSETGAQRWIGLHEATALPYSEQSTVLYPSALAVSPDGTNVYVTGSHRPMFGTHDDALTLSYQA
ncbi:MAG TPA: PQQ-binding-like beta-propeller repeat protein [Actinomycetota bacterium]|nr:PQQ-binding-like beta-propeller repeat protein [Actinomycetota bacterium]